MEAYSEGLPDFSRLPTREYWSSKVMIAYRRWGKFHVKIISCVKKPFYEDILTTETSLSTVLSKCVWAGQEVLCVHANSRVLSGI